MDVLKVCVYSFFCECVSYLVAQIHQQHSLQETNDGYNHLRKPKQEMMKTKSARRFHIHFERWFSKVGGFPRGLLGGVLDFKESKKT